MPDYGKSQRRRINHSFRYLIVNPLLPFDKAPCSSFAVMSPLLSVSTLSQSNNTTMHAFQSSTTYWQIPTCRLLTNGVWYLSFHRCQHQRTKKCDKEEEQAGKGEPCKHKFTTKRVMPRTMKCTLKRNPVFLSPPERTTGRATWDIFSPAKLALVYMML